jgi:glycosyltransferase involved in cell wall biosynthesis
MRILVLGVGPLPAENPPVLHGSCHRTWQFVRPLADDGHDVTLAAIRIPDPRLAGPPVEEHDRFGFRYLLMDEASRFRDDDFMRGLLREVRPDAVIGANVYPACRACELDPGVPVWADINGYIMGEAQAKAHLEDNDGYVHHFWSQMRPALLRADIFSTCSGPQRHALIGELGAAGRLSRRNLGYDLVRAVPNAREAGEYTPGPGVLRGRVCPRNAFIVLAPGVLNVWWDVDVSVRALESAARECSRLHFVCLGGKVTHQDEKSFPRFEALLRASEFADRFHFVGWVPANEVGAYLLEADAGFSVDKDCYESVFGARNRITEMLKAGLPPVSTLGTEITRLVRDHGVGLVSPIGDASSLARNLLRAAENPAELEDMGRRAKDLFRERFTIEATVGPLLDWAREPRRAPDTLEPLRLGGPDERESAPPGNDGPRPGIVKRALGRVFGGGSASGGEKRTE